MPTVEQLSSQFSKYTTYPSDFIPEIGAAASVSVTEGDVAIFTQDDVPAWLYQQYGQLFASDVDSATHLHAAIATPLFIHIRGDADLTIWKGNTHLVIYCEDGSIALTLRSHESVERESTSLELTVERSDVNMTDLSVENTHCFIDRACAIYRDSALSITTALANHGTTTGRTRLLVYEGAHAGETALTLGTGHAWYDLDARLHHYAPSATGNLLHKSVLCDHSQSTIWGMIDIKEGAHAIESYQSAHSILHDTTARSKVVPQLEISNDDVTATHGATIGEIDEESLFYLQSKGIPYSIAKQLICLGFLEAPIRTHPLYTELLQCFTDVWQRIA